MAGLTRERIERLKAVRAEMLWVLSNCTVKSLSRAFIAEQVSKGRSSVAGLGFDAIYELVCLAIKIFDADFYLDPSTRAISLTKRAAAMERMKKRGDDGQDMRPADTKHKHYGTTAAGKIHDALAAREG